MSNQDLKQRITDIFFKAGEPSNSPHDYVYQRSKINITCGAPVDFVLNSQTVEIL